MPDRLLRDAFTELQGQLVATRMMLWGAVDRLSEEQADELADLEAMNVESLRRLWGPTFSDHQKGIVDELEFLMLRLRHRFNFSERDDPTLQEVTEICLKCETFPILRGTAEDKLSCPVCKTSRWLHITRI